MGIMLSIGQHTMVNLDHSYRVFIIVFYFCLMVNTRQAQTASNPFHYIIQTQAKAGDVKRNNGSEMNGLGDGLDATVLSHVEDINIRRIRTLYQLLEHRPEQRTCYSGRSDSTYRFYCPTPSPDDIENGWRCISMDDLCNNIPDCPGAEDEDLVHCMFYMAIQHQAQTLRQIIVRHYEEVHIATNAERT